MNKKIFIFVILLPFLCFGCNAKEIKGYGSPKIGKIVQIISVCLQTEYKDDLIYPKYKIDINLKEKYKIMALQLRSNYLFGQDLYLISSKDIYLNSEDLKLLNTEKHCSIIIEIDPVKKETEKKDNSEGKLNEERISNSFIYLKYK